MNIIILVFLILLLFGGLGGSYIGVPYGYGMGYGGIGIIGILLIVMVVLVLSGRI